MSKVLRLPDYDSKCLNDAEEYFSQLGKMIKYKIKHEQKLTEICLWFPNDAVVKVVQDE